MNYSVCLLAAGKGTRMKLPYNKVFHRLKKKKTVLDMSLSIFLRDSECKQVVLMYAKEDESYMIERYSKIHRVELHEGGMTRQESAGIGLHFVNQDYVMIHDAARPFVTKEQIDSLKVALETEDACLLMIPSVDTIKIVKDGYVETTPLRQHVYNAQTPQCFKTSLLKKCYEKSLLEGRQATDDAQLVEWYTDVPIKVVLGDLNNKKITLPQDIPA